MNFVMILTYVISSQFHTDTSIIQIQTSQHFCQNVGRQTEELLKKTNPAITKVEWQCMQTDVGR